MLMEGLPSPTVAAPTIQTHRDAEQPVVKATIPWQLSGSLWLRRRGSRPTTSLPYVCVPFSFRNLLDWGFYSIIDALYDSPSVFYYSLSLPLLHCLSAVSLSTVCQPLTFHVTHLFSISNFSSFLPSFLICPSPHWLESLSLSCYYLFPSLLFEP